VPDEIAAAQQCAYTCRLKNFSQPTSFALMWMATGKQVQQHTKSKQVRLHRPPHAARKLQNK